MPCHRRKAEVLEKENKKSGKEILRENEKKAKVGFSENAKGVGAWNSFRMFMPACLTEKESV